MNRLNRFTLVVLLFVVLLFSGCFWGKSNQSGLLTIELSDPNPQTASRELFLRETNGKEDSMLVPFSGPRVSVDLPKGIWDLWVWARDSDGRVVGVGEVKRITGGRASVLNLALRSVFDGRIPPEIKNVTWDYRPWGAQINWNVVGDTYQNDEWQIWRSKDGKSWFKIGDTFGGNLSFVDRNTSTKDFRYGVRFADQSPTGYVGPLVLGTGPIWQGVEITWEFKHDFPAFSGRTFGLMTSLGEAYEREYNDLIVHFTSSAAYLRRMDLLQKAGLVIKEEMPFLDVVLAEPSFASELSLAEWSTYSGPDFFVEPNWVVQTESFAPSFKASWPAYLEAIRVPQAQNHVNWHGEIRVAVLDTGLLPSRLPTGTKVVPGYNFVGKNYTTIDDYHGVYHGTDVAKVITEVAPQMTIQPIKVLGSDGRGADFNVALGLLYAAGIGDNPKNPTPAHIVNLSLGQVVPSQVLQNAIEAASQRGVIVVAASGNAKSGKSPWGVMYPAAYPEAIAVGAVSLEPGGPSRVYYSHYGYGLDLVAPEWTSQGTSFSTPMVTGVAGLMLGSGLPASHVRTILARTSIDLGAPGWDEHYGHGLVNAEWAVANITSFDLIIKDRWTDRVVKQEKIPLKGDSVYLKLPLGEYLVEARLNNFTARKNAVIAGDYGEAIHLVLQEP